MAMGEIIGVECDEEEVGTLMFTQENKWFADQGGWQMCARYTIKDVYTLTSIQ